MQSAAAYPLSARVQASAAPPIPRAAEWATRYRPTRSDSDDGALINLSQGVPGAPPPPEMLEKLADATRDPATTGYGPLAGDSSLRTAVAQHLGQLYAVPDHDDKGRRISAENVAITAGCNLASTYLSPCSPANNAQTHPPWLLPPCFFLSCSLTRRHQAFYATMLALAEPGDEIILPTPWYFNAHMTIQQLGLTPVPLPCPAPSFLPSPEDCARLINPQKTRAIVLVTPNNPTGAIYPPELLRQFANLAREHKIALVLDETYRDFVATPPHDLFAETDWPTYLIHLFSFSK